MDSVGRIIESIIEIGQTILLVGIVAWIVEHRKKHAIPVRLAVRIDTANGQSVTGVAEPDERPPVEEEKEKFDS